jgi:c-di-GMP-binding flagellar brake protein YcgR
METEQHHPVGPRGQVIDRRHSARVEVLERVQGELRALALPVTLLDLSQGGFMMQAAVAFTIGGYHDFRFTALGTNPIVSSARVVTMRATAADPGSYLIGLEFVDIDEDTEQAINALIGLLQE